MCVCVSGVMLFFFLDGNRIDDSLCGPLVYLQVSIARSWVCHLSDFVCVLFCSLSVG